MCESGGDCRCVSLNMIGTVNEGGFVGGRKVTNTEKSKYLTQYPRKHTIFLKYKYNCMCTAFNLREAGAAADREGLENRRKL